MSHTSWGEQPTRVFSLKLDMFKSWNSALKTERTF